MNIFKIRPLLIRTKLIDECPLINNKEYELVNVYQSIPADGDYYPIAREVTFTYYDSLNKDYISYGFSGFNCFLEIRDLSLIKWNGENLQSVEKMQLQLTYNDADVYKFSYISIDTSYEVK